MATDATSNYTTDEDVIKIRADFEDIVDSTTAPNFHDEASIVIDTDIIIAWYKTAATDRGLNFRETLYNRDLLLEPDEFKRFAVYKVLSLYYAWCAKDAESSTFELSKFYNKLYQDQLAQQRELGFSYDWSQTGTIISTERYDRKPLRLERV